MPECLLLVPYMPAYYAVLSAWHVLLTPVKIRLFNLTCSFQGLNLSCRDGAKQRKDNNPLL